MKKEVKMDAITISPTELRANQKKYFDMAENTRVFVKRGKKLIELVVSDGISMNPSPSGDPWFDDPRNIAELSRLIKEYEAGEAGESIVYDSTKSVWENID